MKSFFIAVAMLFAASFASSLPVYAVMADATHVEMMKDGRLLFVDAKNPTILMYGVVETLKAAGWQELEAQPKDWAPGPWCSLEISETGGMMYSKCYTPQITGVEVRNIFGTFDYEKNVINLSGVPAMLDKTYSQAKQAEASLGIK